MAQPVKCLVRKDEDLSLIHGIHIKKEKKAEAESQQDGLAL